jgi:hypothetical protein
MFQDKIIFFIFSISLWGLGEFVYSWALSVTWDHIGKDKYLTEKLSIQICISDGRFSYLKSWLGFRNEIHNQPLFEKFVELSPVYRIWWDKGPFILLLASYMAWNDFIQNFKKIQKKNKTKVLISTHGAFLWLISIVFPLLKVNHGNIYSLITL